MAEMQSMVEWLHEHPGRRIVITAAGYYSENGDWVQQEGAATFELNTRLPDGRRVVSRVQVRNELMLEPLATDMIVEEAKTAIACMLSRDPK